MSLRLQTLLVASSLVALSLPALADDEDAAREAFWSGDEAYASGDYEAAIEYFAEANRIAPNPELHEYIGRAHLRLGDRRAALRAFETYAATSAEAADEMELVLGELRVALYSELFDAARFVVWRGVRIARGEEPDPEQVRRNELGARTRDFPVQILSDPRGAEVFIDGDEYGPFGVTPLNVTLFVGAHQIEVRAPYHAPETVELDLDDAQHGVAVLRFELVRETVEVDLTIEPPTARAAWITETGERIDLDAGRHVGRLPAGPGVFVIQSAGEDRRIEDVLRSASDGTVSVRTLHLREPDSGSDGFVVSIGTLIIVSETPGASVRVDGREIGRGAGTFEALVSPGPHTVEVTKDGHEGFRNEIDVPANDELEVTVEQLERRRRRR